ncbi:hypothetical protein BH20ACT22_BH20ACT22_16170 [soil metagenome]
MSSPGAPVSAPAHSSIRTLLEARSVAVVGASRRQDSFGAQLMSQLVGGGFNGDVWPVNPRYILVQGLACVPSISDLPRTPDLVVLAGPNPLVEQQLKAAAEQGCRSGLHAIFYHRHPRRETLALVRMVGGPGGGAFRPRMGPLDG